MAFYHDQVRLLKELRASLELPVTGGEYFNEAMAWVATYFPLTSVFLLNKSLALMASDEITDDSVRGYYHTRSHVISILGSLMALDKHLAISDTCIARRSMQCLIVTTLFHDANHTLGAFQDRYNIALAKATVMPSYADEIELYLPAFMDDAPLSLRQDFVYDLDITNLADSKSFICTVLDTIEASEYPHQSHIRGSHDMAWLFRDLDVVSGMASGNWWSLIYEGLYMEIIGQQPVDNVMSLEQFVAQQVDFVDYQLYSPVTREWLDSVPEGKQVSIATSVKNNALYVVESLLELTK